jgi:hypothetical protein
MKNTIGSFKLVRVLLIAILVIPLAMGTVSPALADVETAPAGWQLVGQPAFWATNVFDTKLALDTSGTPYVAFRSYDGAVNGYKATVMRYNGTAWEVVGTPGFSAGGTQDPSLALDGAGTPYVAYTDQAYGQKATVMRYNGTAWEPVGAPGFSTSVVGGTSLALDAAGTPYVAYSDFTYGQKATVMRYNGSEWQPVGAPGFSTSYAIKQSLALDSLGTPYVAFQDVDNGYKATVMRYNGLAWELVGPPAFTWGQALFINLALDPAGVPYVAYADYSYSMSMFVKRYNGTAWETVGTPGFSGPYVSYASLALDANGAPYVAYPDWTGRVSVMRYVVSVNTAPTANAGGPYLGAINTAISFDGSLSSDPDGDALTYAWDFGDGSATGTGAMPTHSYTAAGVYNVCLTVSDGSLSSSQVCTLAVVYDPSAGFVTGGGWIDSPAGAYKADETLAGKATFGFMSKYQKGASVPTGNTAFQFDLAGMGFASQSYDWLVVNQAGTNAQFKGSGLINGAADPNGNAYKFMLRAGDGSPDTFRIRIWWEDAAGEHDVYDNGTDQVIGAGNIVVHTGK